MPFTYIKIIAARAKTPSHNNRERCNYRRLIVGTRQCRVLTRSIKQT
ncbi:hypothetical protein [Tychonema sp. LEGE 06208]|nr:hypothetical protein [Tychonema sp. LEGE 06208]MBE9165162.1 hypothetical protein [Tychonema sp. LEGE 06208]